MAAPTAGPPGWGARAAPFLVVLAAWVAVFGRTFLRWDTQVATLAGPMPFRPERLPPPSLEVARDLALHLWQYDHTARSLAAGTPLFHTQALTFPAVLDLQTVWGGHLDLLLAVPLVGRLSLLGVSNTVVAVILLACGWGVFWLAREVTGSAWSSAVAAALYLLSPPLLQETANGRVEEVSVGLAAFGLLFLGRWFTRGRVRDLALVALALAVTVLGYLATGIMLAFALPVLALGFLPALLDRSPSGLPQRRAILRRVAWTAAILGLLALPVLALGAAKMHAWLLAGPDPGLLGEWKRHSMEWGVTLPWVFLPFPLGRAAVTGWALPLAALPALFLRRGPGRVLPWLASAAVIHFLAMGSVLRCDQLFRIDSPYAWLPQVFPFLLRFHWPYRFLLLGDLLLAVLAAIGLARLGRRGRTGIGLAAVLSALALAAAVVQVHQLVPMPTRPLPNPPLAYRVIAASPPDGAILEVPARRVFSTEVAQLYHRRPSCCLDLPERLEPPLLAEIDASHPVFWLVRHVARGDIEAHLADMPMGPDGAAQLADLGFSWVVVQALHRSHVAAGCWPDTAPGEEPVRCDPRYTPHAVMRALFGPPVLEEPIARGWLSLYTVRERPPIRVPAPL
ncbi:MAG: hypothetical protein JXB39_06765 [Deltaproteobacteria bacterium]|nr:hypothetical protein [Deltaproteobacteria bacterium]